MITYQLPQRTVKTQPGDSVLRTLYYDAEYADCQIVWRDHFVAMDQQLLTEMQTIKAPVQSPFLR